VNGGAPTDRDHGFYAAVYQSSSDDWGFFEVEGVKTIGASIGSVHDFENAVLAKNGSGSWSSTNIRNSYTTLQGDTIFFGPIPPTTPPEASRFDEWNLIGITRNCNAAVNPAACRAQAVPVMNGMMGSLDPLAQGDFVTYVDPATNVENPFRGWIRNPYTCQQVIMDYGDPTNPFYVDPQNTANRLCDPGGGQCQAPCTATATGACSCPSTSACVPPSNVTGRMGVNSCAGYYAKFAVGPATCPGRVGLWSNAPGLGDDDATVEQSNGAPGVGIGNGAQLPKPFVGFQIDFPSLPATIPVGCFLRGDVSDRQVFCNPVGYGGVLDLVPGRYVDVSVASGGTLVLHPGDYMFDALALDPGATLRLPSGQRVRVVTKNSAELAANVTCFGASGIVSCNPDGTASNFGLMDLGTSPVFANTSMAGTVVAPNAAITVLPGRGGSAGDCSFTVTHNVYDGSLWWGTISFTNDGPASSSNYKVEFDVPPGVHCTADAVPPGATLSPLSGTTSPDRTV
jgi:hypothetical protein